MNEEKFFSQQLFIDIKEAVLDDSYLWIVCHGPPRSSKTTLALWAAYSIYRDWDTALKSVVFNLPSVIHRIQSNALPRWPSRNGLHSRVPIIVYDDFGVHSNKADTQHSTAWDIFKGSFDCLGTEVAVILATMVDANEATQQLQNKYNAELRVMQKGYYKFDRVQWLQDYKGFRSRIKKIWVQDGRFPELPREVYVDYDEMRRELTKEAFVRISDAFSCDFLDQTLRMIKPSDIDLLRLIDSHGPIKHDIAREQLGEEYKLTVTRCKARSLIIPTKIAEHQYRYDLSSLGKDVLDALENDTTKSEQIPPTKHRKKA